MEKANNMPDCGVRITYNTGEVFLGYGKTAIAIIRNHQPGLLFVGFEEAHEVGLTSEIDSLPDLPNPVVIVEFHDCVEIDQLIATLEDLKSFNPHPTGESTLPTTQETT